MSKCWYCNNELTSGDSPKHFGICNKCYDKMFKSGDTIIRSLTNKIADLEAKLAESEKKAYSRGHSQRDIANEIKLNALREDVANKEKRIVELKKQLAEKGKEIEELKLDNEKYFTDSCRANKEIAYKLKQQNQKAIEQLEKIKEICKNKFKWWGNSEWEGNIYDKSDVSNAYFDIEANIDEQIKQLKEMK